MGAGGSVLEHEVKSGNEIPGKNDVQSEDSKMFLVSLALSNDSELPKSINGLSSHFFLRLGKESVDFVDKDTKLPLLNFPYQSILCWGSTLDTFRFTVETRVEGELRGDGRMYKQDKITVQTGLGRVIERDIMKMVRALMADMELSMVNDKDFSELKNLLVVDGKLEEDWLGILQSFTATRSLIAKQAMELLQIIGNDNPFEKVDLACFLYSVMVNKDSFQLVVNCFEDSEERDNLIHRLKLNKSGQVVTTNSMNVYATTKI